MPEELTKRILINELAERAEIDIDSIGWKNKEITLIAKAIKQLEDDERVAVKTDIRLMGGDNIQNFNDYMEELKLKGDLDIGKGGHEYGFEIPQLREEGDISKLILYKRG